VERVAAPHALLVMEKVMRRETITQKSLSRITKKSIGLKKQKSKFKA
jgi:hypothetical protein